MSQARLQLIIDKKREEQEELGAFEDLYELYEDQAKERRNASIWGKVLGGIVGYATGGIGSALLYSTIGSEVAKWGTQLHDEQEVMDLLASETFEGGKFDAHNLVTKVEEEKDWVESRQDAYIVDSLLQGALTGISLNQVADGATFSDLLTGTGGTPGTWSSFWQTEIPSLFDEGLESHLGAFGRNLITGYTIERSPETRDPDEAMNQAALSVLGNYFIPGGG